MNGTDSTDPMICRRIFPKPVVPILPDATIGILGGGYLERELVRAAQDLNYKTAVYCQSEDEPAALATQDVYIGEFGSFVDVTEFVYRYDCAVVTAGSEAVEALRILEEADTEPLRIHPSADIADICADRLRMKRFLKQNRFPTALFCEVLDPDDPLQEITFPALLSRQKGGGGAYENLIRSRDVSGAWRRLGRTPCVLEEAMPFVKMVSVIVARREDGTVRSYAPFENVYDYDILRSTDWPARNDGQSAFDEGALKACAVGIAAELRIVGILCVEMGIFDDGKFLVSNLAAGPHESGCLTVEASPTSQFAQHVRAICGLSFGGVDPLFRAQAVNVAGYDKDKLAKLLNNPCFSARLYGVSENVEPRIRLGRFVQSLGNL